MISQTNMAEVKAIAREAGHAIMKIYTTDDFGVAFKDDDSPLTRADMAAHELIVAGLEKLKLGYPILSEESAEIDWDTRKSWDTYWLVDPLDGTKEFIKQNGEFTVNIALIHEGEPVFGVVYAPALSDLYWGCSLPQQRQAQCNDVDIKVVKPAKPLRVVGSRSHAAPELQAYLDGLNTSYDMVPMGSSLKICLVAAGKADLYPRLGPTSEWDTAAAHAVALGAGAQVLEFESGQPLRYNQKASLLNPHFIVKA